MCLVDSPSIDGFNTRLVSRRLAEEGVIVGLSGRGADELFGGYPSEVRRVWQEFLAKPNALHWSRPLALVVLVAHLA